MNSLASSIKIQLLDSQTKIVEVGPETTIEDLIHEVCSSLELHERELFGLALPTSDGFLFLEPCERIRRIDFQRLKNLENSDLLLRRLISCPATQILSRIGLANQPSDQLPCDSEEELSPSSQITLYFRVRFYVSPHCLIDNTTQQVYFRQLLSNLLHYDLICPTDILERLVALALQALTGNAPIDSPISGGDCYFKVTDFLPSRHCTGLPHNTSTEDDLVHSIWLRHRELYGACAREARQDFIQLASNPLLHFNAHLYNLPRMTRKFFSVSFGIEPSGVVLFRQLKNDCKIVSHQIKWREIRRIFFKRRNLIIELFDTSVGGSLRCLELSRGLLARHLFALVTNMHAYQATAELISLHSKHVLEWQGKWYKDSRGSRSCVSLLCSASTGLDPIELGESISTLRTPISVPGTRSYSLILEAYDLVSRSDKVLIHRSLHRGLLLPLVNAGLSFVGSPRDNVAGWQTVTASDRVAGSTFSLQLMCQPNLYNDTCSKLCTPQVSGGPNDEMRYKCNQNGDKVCGPGWTGVECDRAICKFGCHPVHGSCRHPGECDCATGWQGPFCDQCIKYPGCKHGICQDAPFTCQCLPTWGGRFCDQDLDYCARHRPCRNGGICKNVNESTITRSTSSIDLSYQCTCVPGFTGSNCEIKADPCTLNPCNRGVCKTESEGDDYSCRCDAGWRGHNCDENIDYCLFNACLNGGTCQDLDGVGFKCLCQPGFEGVNCQIRSPCSASKCVHARECRQLGETLILVDHDSTTLNATKSQTLVVDYACLCQPGWTGQFCDQNIDDCVDQCQNGGTCHDLLGDFYCTCPLGFEGRRCEINRECARQPCQNNGICHEITGGFRCECPAGFAGNLCEILVSDCQPNPCQNGAYCYSLPNAFFCNCSSDFYGQFCEHSRPFSNGLVDDVDPLVNPCGSPIASFLSTSLAHKTESEPCGSHGTCVGTSPLDGTYECACATGFTGKYCQEHVDYCQSDDDDGTTRCLHDSTCINLPPYGFECLCRDGFAGDRCETLLDMCDPNPCQNGGYCETTALAGDFRCSCAPGWLGRWCELKVSVSDPCQAGNICFNQGQCYADKLSPGGFRCECRDDWIGSVCHLRHPKSRVCANPSQVCKNGATCVDIGLGFNCVCRPGFTGTRCEIETDECSSMPCFNNGTCRDLINTFECDCPPGFIGSDCRINVDECASNPCSFGSTCIDKVGSFECKCPQGRYGQLCDRIVIGIDSRLPPPKPPGCNYLGRLFDHGQTWTHNCQRCNCTTGHTECVETFCGYWSCLTAFNQSDRFACRQGQICQSISQGHDEDYCLVEPCYQRAVCFNASRPIQGQIDQLLHTSSSSSSSSGVVGPASFSCQPSTTSDRSSWLSVLNNQCAWLALGVSTQRLPYSTNVGDLCDALRHLPSMEGLGQSGRLLGAKVGLTCKAIEDVDRHILSSDLKTVLVTLSSTNDKLTRYQQGQETALVHQLAANLSQEISDKASTNLSLSRDLLRQLLAEGQDGVQSTMRLDIELDENENAPLPPANHLLGTPLMTLSRHRALLGVVEIEVGTKVVGKEVEGSPLTVPLTCALILLLTCFLLTLTCLYAQFKRRQLLLRFAPPMLPNNAIMGDFKRTTAMHRLNPHHPDASSRPRHLAYPVANGIGAR